MADLIRVCFVFPRESINDLEEWLFMSPDHFYIRYKFPKLKVEFWNDKQALSYKDLPVCMLCAEEKLKQLEDLREFLAYAKDNPLPVLDLFGGVGAFSLGLAEGSGCLKLENTIEISPSAARTTQ
jgi:DNA (cytosine-5)-methyltransferase 1